MKIVIDTNDVRRVAWRSLRAFAYTALWFSAVGAAVALMGGAIWMIERLFGANAIIGIPVILIAIGVGLAFVVAYREMS